HVVQAGTGCVEEAERSSFVILVVDGGELVINAIHVILLPIIADIPVVRAAIGIQHAKVCVKAAVFLEHEEHMVHGRKASSSGNCYGGRGGCLGSICGGGCGDVSSGLRRRDAQRASAA